MAGTGREVQEEGFVRSDLLAVGDHADGLVDEVLAEVVALFWRIGLVDRVCRVIW